MARGADYQVLGSSASHLLSAAPYSTLIIEIHYMPGFRVDTAVTASLVKFLNNHLNKPGGIFVEQHLISTSNKRNLTLKEIVDIERNSRRIFTDGNTIAIHFIITDSYYYDETTLAVSYFNTSICLFGQTINENSGNSSKVTRNRLFDNVMQHEMGHLLGLVNQGSPMLTNHAAGNGDHCIATSCLMFTEIETDASAMLHDLPVLDDDCINDLRANGGR